MVFIDRGTCSLEIDPEILSGEKSLVWFLDHERRKEIIHEQNEQLLADTPPDHFFIHNTMKKLFPECVMNLQELSKDSPKDSICEVTPVYRLVLNGSSIVYPPQPLYQDDLPEMMLISGMHSREWMAQEAVLNMILLMMEEYVGNSKKTQKKPELILWIIPCVNIFGLLSSAADSIKGVKCPREMEPEERRMTRKCCGKLGVDSNRCFPIAWNSEKVTESSHDCFPGEKPLENPETVILNSFIQKRKDSLILMADIHTCGDCVFQVPIFNPELYDNESVSEITQIMKPFIDSSATHLLKSHKRDIKKMYDAGGSFVDYCIFWGGIPSLALEVGEMSHLFESDSMVQEKRKKELSLLLLEYFPKFVGQAKEAKAKMAKFTPAFDL